MAMFAASRVSNDTLPTPPVGVPTATIPVPHPDPVPEPYPQPVPEPTPQPTPEPLPPTPPAHR
jgi:hypothetical protein